MKKLSFSLSLIGLKLLYIYSKWWETKNQDMLRLICCRWNNHVRTHAAQNWRDEIVQSLSVFSYDGSQNTDYITLVWIFICLRWYYTIIFIITSNHLQRIVRFVVALFQISMSQIILVLFCMCLASSHLSLSLNI